MTIPVGQRRPRASTRTRSAALRRLFLEVERCEERTLMATMLGVDVANNLIRFTSAAPGTVVSTTPITGLAGATGETIAGMDYRPIDTTLYAVTGDAGGVGRLYTIDIATGSASLRSTLTADPADATAPYAGLSGTSFGVDFNPVADRLRVVSNDGQNLRINVDTGRVTTDTNLNPGTPAVAGAAYTNNFPNASTTSLYDIDTATDTLVLQSPPNNGTLSAVGMGLGVDVSDVVGFDIQTVGMTNTAYASLVVGGTTGLYTIDLTTGAASLVGTVGASIRNLAITPDAYTAALVGDVATFTGTAAGATITIDTSGGLVRHNRYSQGDSGFNSDFDFDSTVPGDQTLSVSSLTAQVLINAVGGNDTATIDFAGGNPIPGGGINFDGGTGNNTLILRRTSGNYVATSEIHTATGPGAGTILIDGQTVEFENLAPVIDILPAVDFTFTPPDISQTINIVNGASFANTVTTRIVSGAGPAAFEQVDFANKQFVAVNGSSSADLITLNNPNQAAGLEELDIFARTGDDTVSVVGSALSSTLGYFFDGGGGVDTLTLDSGSVAATVGLNTILFPNGAQIDYVNFENVIVANVTSPTPVVQSPAITFSATENTQFTNQPVARFASTRPGALASQFAATINWGDGTSSAGLVVPDATIPSTFSVLGSHTYLDSGPFTVTTTILDNGGTSTQTVGGQTITTTFGPSATATASASAQVGDAAIVAQGTTITPVEGTSFSGLVATFTTNDPGAIGEAFTATIDWGDGTTSPGTYVTFGSADGVTFLVSGTHTYATDGTYPVTVSIVSPGGSFGSASGQAIVADVLVTGGLVDLLRATVGTPLTNVNVANFSDAGTENPVSEYDATIDWGDGTALSAGRVVATDGGFQVVGSHTFASSGNFTGRATIHASEGATLSILFSTSAVSPSLAITPLTVTEGQALVNVAIATLSNAGGNPAIAPNFYTAIVDFGDGTDPVLGFVDSNGAVRASHIYEESGTYTTRVTVGTTGNPNVVTASASQVVLDVPIVLVAALAQTSDTGQSNLDGITRDTTPTFQGTSEPGSLIRVFARPLVNGVQGNPVPIASAVTDAAGAWQATALQPLADGAYTIQVTAIDDNGVTTASNTLALTLVIDTVGPRVTDVAFDRLGGRAGATLQDERSGLDQSTVRDGSNYRFAGRSLVRGYHGPSRFVITSLEVGANSSATSPQSVIATFNQGRAIRGGRYVFTIFSGLETDNRGIRDVAGNALDGEYYGFLPSGNLKVGGDFVAGLNAFHNTIFVPRPVQDGFATPLNPPGTRGTIRNVNNPGIQGLTVARARRVKGQAHPVGPRAHVRHR